MIPDHDDVAGARQPAEDRGADFAARRIAKHHRGIGVGQQPF
jgi:hypothetical protein